MNNKVTCPNCGVPCVGCAGARLTKASDGSTCCTKCVHQLEAKIRAAKTNPPKQ